MHYSTCIMMVLADLVILTTGSAVPAPDPTLNATVGQWTGLSKAGVNVIMVGTSSQIDDHLKEFHPGWEPVENAKAVGLHPVTFDTPNTDHLDHLDHLEKRNPSPYTNCCPVAAWDWAPTSELYVDDVVAKLNANDGTYYADPYTCSQVDCQWNVGVYFCSSSDVQWSITGRQVATYVDNIMLCPVNRNIQDDISHCGQAWSISKEAWNVIVHWCN